MREASQLLVEQLQVPRTRQKREPECFVGCACGCMARIAARFHGRDVHSASTHVVKRVSRELRGDAPPLEVGIHPDDLDHAHTLVECVEGDGDEPDWPTFHDRDEGVPLVARATRSHLLGLSCLPVGLQPKEDGVRMSRSEAKTGSHARSENATTASRSLAWNSRISTVSRTDATRRYPPEPRPHRDGRSRGGGVPPCLACARVRARGRGRRSRAAPRNRGPTAMDDREGVGTLSRVRARAREEEVGVREAATRPHVDHGVERGGYRLVGHFLACARRVRHAGGRSPDGLDGPPFPRAGRATSRRRAGSRSGRPARQRCASCAGRSRRGRQASRR